MSLILSFSFASLRNSLRETALKCIAYSFSIGNLIFKGYWLWVWQEQDSSRKRKYQPSNCFLQSGLACTKVCRAFFFLGEWLMWEGPAHSELYYTQAGAPGLYKRGSSASHGQQANSSTSPQLMFQFLSPGSWFELLTWLPSVSDCDVELEAKGILSSPGCRRPCLVFSHSNRK